MRFYTLDRNHSLRPGQTIRLFNDYMLNGSPDADCVVNHVRKIFPDGITEHGNRYMFSQISNNNTACEVIFEFVRALHFPSKLSRFQSFFAVDKKDIDDMACALSAKQYQVWEVEADYFERYDMTLLKGADFSSCSFFAQKYWNGDSTEKPLYEFLLRPPVTIIRAYHVGGQS